MHKYPKIETLWDRDDKTHRVIPGAFRLPHFKVINQWRVTEKIDGTNVRVGIVDKDHLDIRGRTDKAQMPLPLVQHLQGHLSAEKMLEVFDTLNFTLYGEGYGAGIQKGGIYSDTQRFVLFDVIVGGWWLRWADVLDVAEKLGLHTVPCAVVDGFFPHNKSELRDMVSKMEPLHSEIDRVEGVVVRSDPQMFTRKGDRVAWKLKFKDFA